MSVLAIIPARGGSRGIPRKNLREVAGKPLIVWTIEQALAATPTMDVVVSTDDAEIAEVARAAGARVPFLRPAELAQDTTATEPVVLHALTHVRAEGGHPQAVMLLQATSPVRLPGTLTRALDEFAQRPVDALVGVVPASPFLWSVGPDGSGRPSFDPLHRPRRQDLDPAQIPYRETGSVYLTRSRIWDEVGNRLGGRIGLFVMDEVEGVDIDTATDLAQADQLLATLDLANAPDRP